MSRRQFDDYDAHEWQEENERVGKERRKRDAKKQRHHLDEDETDTNNSNGRPRSNRQPD